MYEKLDKMNDTLIRQFNQKFSSALSNISEKENKLNYKIDMISQNIKRNIEMQNEEHIKIIGKILVNNLTSTFNNNLKLINNIQKNIIELENKLINLSVENRRTLKTEIDNLHINESIIEKCEEYINKSHSNWQKEIDTTIQTFRFNTSKLKNIIDEEQFQNRTVYYYDSSENCETQCFRKTFFLPFNETFWNRKVFTNITKMLQDIKQKWARESFFITDSNIDNVDIEFLSDKYKYTFSFIKTNCSFTNYAKQKCQFGNDTSSRDSVKKIWSIWLKLLIEIISIVTFSVAILYVTFVFMKNLCCREKSKFNLSK